MNCYSLLYSSMKAKIDHCANEPNIEISKNTISVNQEIFHESVLFDSTWYHRAVSLPNIEDWIKHPYKKDVLTIITGYNITPSHRLFDLFWSNHIPVDILSLKSAIRQAKMLQIEKKDYQLLIYSESSGYETK